MNRPKFLHVFLAAIFFVFLAAPASVSALEKRVITFDFASHVSQEGRVNFTDAKFNDYVDSNLNGYLLTTPDHGWLLLEGDGATIDGEFEELYYDDRTVNVDSVSKTNPDTATWSAFRTHSELDPRANADATTSGNLKRVYLRVKFGEEVTDDSDATAIVDEYFNAFSNEGLGGVLIAGGGPTWIAGGGPTWMPIAIEGTESDVDSWIATMQDDERFESVNVLRSYQPSSQTLLELWSHTSGDARETSQ